jgi:hypothetical protein
LESYLSSLSPLVKVVWRSGNYFDAAQNCKVAVTANLNAMKSLSVPLIQRYINLKIYRSRLFTAAILLCAILPIPLAFDAPIAFDV